MIAFYHKNYGENIIKSTFHCMFLYKCFRKQCEKLTGFSFLMCDDSLKALKTSTSLFMFLHSLELIFFHTETNFYHVWYLYLWLIQVQPLGMGT